jgi:hypothetical protein
MWCIAQTLLDYGSVLQETDACETLVLPPNLAWKAADAIDRQHHPGIDRQSLVNPDLGATVRKVDRFAFQNTAILVQCCIPRHLRLACARGGFAIALTSTPPQIHSSSADSHPDASNPLRASTLLNCAYGLR